MATDSLNCRYQGPQDVIEGEQATFNLNTDDNFKPMPEKNVAGEIPYHKQLEWIEKPFRTKKIQSHFRGEILHEIKLSESLYGVHCIKIDHDGEQMVLGFGSGEIQVRDLATGTNCSVIRRGAKNSVPVTSLKFHPKSTDLVYAGTCCGKILKCNVAKVKYGKFSTESANEINCLDINRTGETLASAGKDAAIRLYSVETEKLQSIVAKDRFGRNSSPKFHSMRIYALKFHPNHSELFFSGGWDDCIKCWDKRVPDCWVQNIHGPRICGDSIDVQDNQMVTGSWTTKDSLQLWDWRCGTLISLVSPLNRTTSIDGEFTYGIKFFSTATVNVASQKCNANQQYVLAGGSGTGALEVIEINDRSVVGSFTSPKSIRAFDSRKSIIVYGGLEKLLKIAQFV